MIRDGKESKKFGMAPGALIYVGRESKEPVRITLMEYSPNTLEERAIETLDECLPIKDPPTITWLNVYGLYDIDVIRQLGEHFGLHPLVLEDIVNTDQRPKVEDLGRYIYVVTKLFQASFTGRTFEIEHFNLILGPSYVLTFQERFGNLFDPLRDRIRSAKGRIRKAGPDYLAYALLDAVSDHYFSLVERLGEHTEALEEKLMVTANQELLHEIYSFKRKAIVLRKSIWPMREIVLALERSDSQLIHEETAPFLKDLYDHSIQVIDLVEMQRDLLSGMLDLYLSSISNRMNEVMKVLTLTATIFIPLTFIAGIYGMNFEYMPELQWRLGYPLVFGVMLLVVGTMLLAFKRKGWL